jgi:hypothetical protein
MSDFLYSKKPQPPGRLAGEIRKIYHEDPPEIIEFHGTWGSLAASKGHYFGFDPVETEEFICVILGGPVLMFADNLFIGGSDRQAGTNMILKCWSSCTGIRWDEDVSGPFAALKVEKKACRLDLVTDLMSFIPIFEARNYEFVGTHVDCVAGAAGLLGEKDEISMADFVLNGTVTYPHTIYQNVQQLQPGTTFTRIAGAKFSKSIYWQPIEEDRFEDVVAAASFLADGLTSYIAQITSGLEKTALFLSGGEDSRTVLGMIPQNCKRDAFIFLDQMNREGRVAHAAAQVYDAQFTFIKRDEHRYLDVLPACADLVGAGSQYSHVHSYGLAKSAELASYRAVFGGFLSDTFLKGLYIPRFSLERFGLFYHIPRASFPNRNHQANLISVKYQNKVHERIQERSADLKNSNLSHALPEWARIYPISMHSDTPHFFGQRRLFAIYEPFTSHSVVTALGAIPAAWKLNRVLFQKMAKPFLAKSRYLLHANGWLPYFPWTVNLLIRPLVSVKRRLDQLLFIDRGNQGPWNDWSKLKARPEWWAFAEKCLIDAKVPPGLFVKSLSEFSDEEKREIFMNVNAVQLLYQCIKE